MRARALGHLPGGIPAVARRRRALVAVSRPARLYHYTSTMHLPVILQSGHLRLTESNIETSGAGPGVVWFTDSPSAVGIGVTKGFKDAVEICIDTPAAAEWWPQFAREHGIEDWWYEALAKAAEGSPDHWWVVPHPVPVSDFVSLKVNGKTFKTGSTETTAADDSDDAETGVMVALIPEQAASMALLEAANGTEEFDEQHITLLYLGTTEQAGGDAGRERLHRAVYDFAIHSGHDVLTGTANGWGVFNNPGETALVALWDIPGIAEFRAALKASVTAHGVPMRTENHGFTPHSTMSYFEGPVPGLPDPVEPAPQSIFTHVVIAWGNEWSSVALPGALGDQQQVAAMLRTALDPGSRWEESKHPRGGNPANPGEFSRGTKVPESKRPDRTHGPEQLPPPALPAGPQQTRQTPPNPAPHETPAAKAVYADREDTHKDTSPEVYHRMHQRGDLYAGHKDHLFINEGKYPKGDPRNDPEFEARAQMVEHLGGLHGKYASVSRDEALRTGMGGTTDVLHDQLHNPQTGKDDLWDPDRRELHAKVISDFVAEKAKGVPREGKCLIMAGPSGAGKSTFLNRNNDKLGVTLSPDRKRTLNYVTVNPDDFKEKVPVDMARYPGLSENETASLKHEESSLLAKQAVEALMAQGYNVILDVTLASAKKAVEKYVDPAFAQKYTYEVALVDGDMANSRQNAGNRYKATDKKTGERTFSGRFIDMALIEEQAPTQPGFRSKNAEQFVQFAQHPRVKRAYVYDPLNPDKPLADAKAAVHEAILRNSRLSGILRAEGGPIQVPNEPMTTEITEKIKAFRAGTLSREQLVKYLAQDVRYQPEADNPYAKGTVEWYRWLEGGRTYTPGSFDEVILARNLKALPHDVYMEVVRRQWSNAVAAEAERNG